MSTQMPFLLVSVSGNMSLLNPRTKHFEFGGPFGTLILSVGLPALIDVLFFSCNRNGCPDGLAGLRHQLASTEWLNWPALFAFWAWLLALAILDVVIPGNWVQGTQLRSGGSLHYKFNGTRVLGLLAVALSFRWVQTAGEMPELQFIYANLLQLANASILTAFIVATFLYAASYRQPEPLLALGGNSGNVVYDWFIGRELNPRIGNLDLKLFLEMRPGLILWIILNLTMVHHQYLYFGEVTRSIVLVTIFQAWYVIEGTFYESGLVSMIDTTHDGLGFMLVFGDIALVPFTYSLQTRFLADHPTYLNVVTCAAITAIYILGIAVFRMSNNEKNRFKQQDPSTAHLKYLETPTGSKLLYTGWWGVARHINYTADWFSALAYSLPCGTAVIPYYYLIYFASLLIHRESRDEAKCAAKYGEVWEEYKRRVPYRFIPYIW